MNPFVFYAGNHRLDVLGATRLVAQNVVASRAKVTCFLLGCGRLESAAGLPYVKQKDISRPIARRSFPHRAAAKLFRTTIPHAEMSRKCLLWINDHINEMADRVAAGEVQKLFEKIPGLSLVMGLSSMSAAVGAAAKKNGRRYLIHNQWFHPLQVNKLLGEAYEKLGIQAPAFSSRKTERQLEEYALADMIWCPSGLVKESLAQNGVPVEKLFVANLGIELKRYRTPADPHGNHDSFTLLFIGRVCVQKGVHVLLEALVKSDLDNARVIFNGVADAAFYTLLRRHAEALERKRVNVRVDPGDPRRHLQNASVLVLPSLAEAFGLVVLEGMAAGLPVIVSSQVGAKECIDPGRNGFVFESGDSEKLAEHLSFFFHDRDARIEFGRRSQKKANEYDIEAAGEKLFEKIAERMEKLDGNGKI